MILDIQLLLQCVLAIQWKEFVRLLTSLHTYIFKSHTLPWIKAVKRFLPLQHNYWMILSIKSCRSLYHFEEASPFFIIPNLHLPQGQFLVILQCSNTFVFHDLRGALKSINLVSKKTLQKLKKMNLNHPSKKKLLKKFSLQSHIFKSKRWRPLPCTSHI